MRLTLRQLQIFSAIAELGSTTAAAASIPLSQSATSAALAELESLLGASLFDRVGRRLILNETGRSLQSRARIALNSAMEIERDFGVGDGAKSAFLPAHIRLGASTTIGNYVMPARIARLQREQPHIAVEMRIDNTQEVVNAVMRMEVDAGLIEGPCHAEDLDVEPWGTDQMVIVAAADHPFVALGRPASTAELRQERWLVREEGSGTRELLDHLLLPHLGGFGSCTQLGDTEAIKQATATGLGVSCLSLCAVGDQLALGRLAVLQTALPPLTRSFYRIRHRYKTLSPALGMLLAHGEGEDPWVLQANASG
ncbi:LysR family transcriptional regulator [Variovorax sp. YR216]|uniref:LysR family transcriptional regulator n=1 Tax=Variovorax sp. YR216 TaxID=1882828 RepID=UPI0008997396|nr:LysR family transcriptional regulator [Variovorax sp. YR216]SEB21901.1 DNA-binding transcriptional regulator, LysR family [Variovorax sp. YR216]